MPQELRGLVHALRCAALGPAGDDAVGGGGGLAGGWRGGPLRVHRLVGALLVFLELREQAVRGGRGRGRAGSRGRGRAGSRGRGRAGSGAQGPGLREAEPTDGGAFTLAWARASSRGWQ